MKLFLKGNIGVLSYSWYPKDMHDDANQKSVDDLLPLILDIAKEYNIKVCIHIEPYKDRKAITVRNDIMYIVNKYGIHDSFYRYKGLPLFYIYDSYLIDEIDWMSILTSTGSNTVCFLIKIN